jgi:UDP-N-acetylglucosamine 2-epimerase (non-hydrolysing)
MAGVKYLLVFGTRPEAIKLACVYRALKNAGAEVELCSTGQHNELLKSACKVFDLAPDHEINAMQPDQSLNMLTARILEGLTAIYRLRKPAWVIVQGDATSALAGALAAYYEGIKIAHVEAGLATGDLQDPYPEEGNRRMIAQIANVNFAPTRIAFENLRNMGAPGEIYVTGNTAVDAIEATKVYVPLLRDRYVLITMHRRESFGQPLRDTCQAVKELAGKYPATKFIWSVHPNPNVCEVVHEILEGCNVALQEAPDYETWTNYLRHAYFVMTDSGGIQEEAPSFGVPVLVLRNKTERPEGVTLGFARIVGTEKNKIIEEAAALLDDQGKRDRMSACENPYGDGKAAQRIAEVLLDR